MPRSAHRFVRAALAAGLAAGLVACGSSGSGSSGADGGLPTVTLGVSPYVGLAPLYLGIQQGFFTKAGINLKLVSVAAPPTILQAVTAEQDDLGFAVVPSVILAASKGADVKCVAQLTGNVSEDRSQYLEGIVVRHDSPLKTPRDLVGKRVAVAAFGGEQAILTQAVVDKAGGDWKQVNLVPLAFGVMNTSLKSGTVDAIATTEPFLDQAVAAGGRVISWIEHEVTPTSTNACTVANGSFISEHPDLVTKFRTAIGNSLSYAATHIADARATLPGITGITAAAAKTVPLGTTFTPALDITGMSKWQQLMVTYGYLKNPLPLNKFLSYPGVG